MQDIGSKKAGSGSPGVGRAVAILNFLAEHPQQAFTLAEIVRSLRMSRTTCYTLLGALVEVGYLYRTSARSYILGPTLAAVGKIAYDNLSPLQVARSEMRALADNFDAICSAIFLENGLLVVRERAVAASHVHWPSPMESSDPLKPPFGAVFMAWSSRAEIQDWMSRTSDELSAEDIEIMESALAFSREHGFAFGQRRTPISDPRRARELFRSVQDTKYLNSSLEPGREYQLAFVTAPVFDFRAKVSFTLALAGFTGSRTGAEVEEIGRNLRTACDRITSFGLGHSPEA